MISSGAVEGGFGDKRSKEKRRLGTESRGVFRLGGSSFKNSIYVFLFSSVSSHTRCGLEGNMEGEWRVGNFW